MVAPVARPSSTRITVLPRKSGNGRLPRYSASRRSSSGFLGSYGSQHFLRIRELRHDVFVDNSHAARGDRTHRELTITGNAELSHHENIERDAQRRRHFVPDRHTTPRQGEHDHVGVPRVFLQMLREDATRLVPVAKARPALGRVPKHNIYASAPVAIGQNDGMFAVTRGGLMKRSATILCTVASMISNPCALIILPHNLNKGIAPPLFRACASFCR